MYVNHYLSYIPDSEIFRWVLGTMKRNDRLVYKSVKSTLMNKQITINQSECLQVPVRI